jgi:hypothetical protein
MDHVRSLLCTSNHRLAHRAFSSLSQGQRDFAPSVQRTVLRALPGLRSFFRAKRNSTMSPPDLSDRLTKLEQELQCHKMLLTEHESKIKELTVKAAAMTPATKPIEASFSTRFGRLEGAGVLVRR